MFKKATARQLLSVSGLFILVWQTALGQEIWNGHTYLPGPLPVRKIEKNMDTGVLGKMDEHLLVYDARSKVLRSPELTPKATSFPHASSTQSWPGSFQSFPLLPEKAFSSLQKVEDLSVAPWRMQVKLFVTGADGQRYTCSGTLIDPEYVLTACHCLFSSRKGGWAQEVEVVPAYEQGNAPYGSALMEEALVWEEWIENRNYSGDMAVMKLDRPIGAITGWLGYGFRSEDAFFKDNTFHNPSYPASSPYDGQALYSWTGDFDYLYGKTLAYHKNLAYAGQSGSGTFFWEKERSAVVLSVLSHGTPEPNPFTGHVRMTKEKFLDIRSYIEESRSSELDVMPLYVQTPQSSYQTTEPFNQCRFVLYNTSNEDFDQPLEVVLELLDKNGRMLELGRTTVESVQLEAGKSQVVALQDLGWAWPQTIQSGDYALAVRLLLKDAQLSNNLSAASEQKLIYIEKEEKVDFVKISPQELEIKAQGGAYSLQLSTHSDLNWEIHALVDWITVTPSSGKGNADIQLEVGPYTGAEQRATSLLAMAGSAETEVQLIQQSDLAVDEIVLSPGWNLISLDVDPIDNRVAEVIKGLKPGNLIQVNGIDNGKYQYYRPANSEEANSLKVFKPGAAYWIQLKEADVLIARGRPIEEDFPVQLQTGRNLVAYIPQEPQRPQLFFKEMMDAGRLKYIIAFEKGKSLRFDPANPAGSSLQWLENGKGFWVEIASENAALQDMELMPALPAASRAQGLFSLNKELNYHIRQFSADDIFYIQINNQQKGTLLLMISDLNGRTLKEQRLPLRQRGEALFPLTYEGLLSPYLVLSLFFNQQHIDSRVYLND
jgi:V8-like Glu-specific endopeptidase